MKPLTQYGRMALYFQSVPGKTYQIELTERLGGEWVKVVTTSAGWATQRRAVLDRPATTGFYRIVLAAGQ